MKRKLLMMLCATITAFGQTPAERDPAILAAQNTALQSLLQHTPKLPLQPTAIKGASMVRVSWIAMDSSKGLIYLLQRDLKTDPVVVLDQSGRTVYSWGKGMFSTPHAIRIDPQGNVWTTDARTSVIYEFSPEGKTLLKIEVGGLPDVPSAFRGTTDIAFAPNGRLFIADGYRNARILEFTPKGQKVREWGSAGTGPGQFHVPHSIQIDESGVIYVADRENGRIQRFDLAGKYLGEWSNFGKTFGLKLAGAALWLSSFPRGPEAARGWLLQVDRKSGSLLGYVDTTSGHGIEVNPEGEILAAAPGPDESPFWYRLAK